VSPVLLPLRSLLARLPVLLLDPSRDRLARPILSAQEIDGKLPASLADVGWVQKDPWGNEYRFLNFALSDPKQADKNDGKPKGARRDKVLKPLNSTYDLYSVGEDGQTKPSLTQKESWDDIVRAADGVFIGLATDF